MLTAVILSPHRDDAVFSLGLCLARWSRRQIPLRVINFFTLSSYAPYARHKDLGSVSRIRRQEDQKVLGQISPGIQVRDLNLVDAPVRLNIPENSVCNPDTSSPLEERDVSDIASHICRFSRFSLILAPLALGDHIDHLLVRAGALRSMRGKQLAFYEDLPYATWIPAGILRARVADTELQLGYRLHPVVTRDQDAVSKKRKLAAAYRSQISAVEADVIARWSAKYGGGERIWAPASSGAWLSFLRRSDGAFSG
ncbi:MAG: PIG-L family deacetylase [Acidobacteriaceae bacterium]|nr:PIG-L family deacetylase [Acidobacteriaceae bacterium]